MKPNKKKKAQHYMQKQEWIRVGERLNLRTPTYRCSLCGRYIAVPYGKAMPKHCSCDTLHILYKAIMPNQH